ncbi:hypothetical protein E1212_24305 [Jiangella ureilytica]|uniref:Uncharacterized protein n=1 Tax=Jiangella ureilytica TaxID=2530374 RepID=A0A4R4RE25_9ACTN|nr:hypothetical protein [Jiangella ureilytica]TDC47396.1 hypothetical protein E1212_24305 [Jiangella ureilytica]
MSRPSTRRRGITVVAAVLTLLFLATGCRVIAYDLAPESQRYRMTVDQQSGGSTVRTAWEFTSARVVEDDTPDGTICFGNYVPEIGLGGPCEAEPLIFLGYEFGLDLANTAPAGRRHMVEVTGYYEDETAPLEVVELTAWASFDEGGTWSPLGVEPVGGGTFAVAVDHPAARDGGSVWLRVHAVDTEGNTVEQTIENAYGLRR